MASSGSLPAISRGIPLYLVLWRGRRRSPSLPANSWILCSTLSLPCVLAGPLLIEKFFSWPRMSVNQKRMKREARAGKTRYDLARREHEQLRVFYGVTDEGMEGEWGA